MIDLIKILGCAWILHNPLNFQRFLLVQISETMKGKARQSLGGAVGAGLVSKGISAISALKDKAVKAFDKANQDKVSSIIGPVLQPSPSNIPSSLNPGSSGNSGWRMRWTQKC